MPLELQLIRAREFIRVGPRGKIDLTASRSILESLAAACRKRGIERALLDLRDVWSDFGPEELAHCVEMFHRIGFPHVKRLALLHSGDPHRRVRLLALIGSLRGWAIRAFADFEGALDWLALSEERRHIRRASLDHEVPIKRSRTASHSNSG
jgi:hypothetical protein